MSLEKRSPQPSRSSPLGPHKVQLLAPALCGVSPATPAPTWHQQGSLGAGARGWKGYNCGPAAGAVSRCRSINRSWLPNLLATAFHSLPVFSCFFLQGGACSPGQPSAPPLP